MAENDLWEYYVETLGSSFKGCSDEELVDALNALGEEGWQVFSVENPLSPKIRIVARRPLSRSTRRKRSWPGD